MIMCIFYSIKFLVSEKNYFEISVNQESKTSLAAIMDFISNEIKII